MMILFASESSRAVRRFLPPRMPGLLAWFFLSIVTLRCLTSDAPAGPMAFGGDITNHVGSYRIHIFTNVGVAYTFTIARGGNLDALILAGGGGGGGRYYSGGGGAGGCILFYDEPYVAGDYSVSIGAGGAGGSGESVQGANGANTVFGAQTALGGGGGGSYYNATLRKGKAGGCGGGASGYGTPVAEAGAGTPGQGQPGAPGATHGGGGGGGTAFPGLVGTSAHGGNGGGGIYSTISGEPAYYGGGGGGGAGSSGSGLGGQGGGGGGGDGGAYATTPAAMPGQPNTGGGGGGTGYNVARGAAGGSGIVIIRYLVDAPYIEPLLSGELTETTVEARVRLVMTGLADATLTVFWDTTDHGPSTNWPHSASLPAEQPGVFSHTITGLLPDTDYYYIWRATNDYGEYFLSQSQQVHTRGKFYYVHPDVPFSGDGSKWSTAFKTIQEALDISVFGETIYLAGRGFALDAPLEWTGQYVTVRGGYKADDDMYLPGPQNPFAWQTLIYREPYAQPFRLMSVNGAHHAHLRDVTLTGGYLTDAAGAGILVEDSLGVHLQDCKIVGNELGGDFYGAAVASFDSEVCFDYCLISDNRAGDALYAAGSSQFDVRNCTIANNVDVGIRVSSSSLTVKNSIIWGSMPGIFGITPNAMGLYENLWHSCLCDGKNSGVQGCISDNPLFVGAGDYHLSSVMGRWFNGAWMEDPLHSPCIDAGDPLADVSKEPAPNGGRLNMGVYGNTSHASKSYVGPELLVPVTSLTNAMLYSFNPPELDFYISVTSAWHRKLAYNIVSDAPWLFLSEYGGIATQGVTKVVQAVFETDTLPSGQHHATLRVSACDAVSGFPATNAEQEISVTMHVLPPPGIFALPGGLTNEVEEGHNAPSQELWVSNNSPWFACAALNQAGDDWLFVTPQTNRLPVGESVPLLVNYSTSLLPRGTYNSVVVIEGSVEEFEIPADNAAVIPVRLVVKRTPPRLSIKPAAFSIGVQQGSHAANAIMRVQNTGSPNNMPFDVEVNAPWLSVNPPHASSTGQVQELILSFDTASLPVGDYAASVKVVAIDEITSEPALNSPWSVVVNLNVYPPGGALTNLAIRASQGIYSEKIEVNWDSTPAAAWYELWRNGTVDLVLAEKMADLRAVSYTDTAVMPGMKYSYWVRPIGLGGSAGPFSTNAIGWSALAPPATITATPGVFADRVKVEWSSSESADSYEVWRNTAPVSSGAIWVYTTARFRFEDFEVHPGETYYYWVRSMRSVVASPFGLCASGYAMGAPSGLSVSKGDFTEKIRATWAPAPGALSYEVWRSHNDQLTSAIHLFDAESTVMEDHEAQAGKMHTYWVRAANPGARSEFCAPDRGYRSIALADLESAELVWLPGILAPGQAPEVVNWRLSNNGPAALAGANTRVLVSLWASNRQTHARTHLADWDRSLALEPGSSVRLEPTPLERSGLSTLPVGEHDLYLQVRHNLPSTLGDPNSLNNVVTRAGPVRVRPGPATGYLVKNDYNADGRSDLAVIHRATSQWFVRGLAGDILIWAQAWGGAGLTPSSGDFDGDRASDLVAYAESTGRWFVYSSLGAKAALWNEFWGGVGFYPVWGDFDGDGRADMALYHSTLGHWYISGLVFGQLWGGDGYDAVAGDYDGDARSDLAVYERSSGRWFIRSAPGLLLLWSEPWGGPGMVPVSGDFDGDGKWDLAVYQEATGAWYIKSMTGRTLVWGLSWGGPGMVPVAGDFDGDGRWDLGVYQEATGAWYIWSLTQGLLAFGELWGGPGFETLP